MSFDPQWSAQLASSSGPIQPLRAGSVRNGLLGDITWALTVDVQFRGRYASVFTWGQQFVDTDPMFADRSIADKKAALRTLGKLLAVTTLQYQETEDVEAGTSGLVGKEKLRGQDILENDPIDLARFELRDNNSAVSLTNTNRYYLFLRDRDTQLGLTGVGDELAATMNTKMEPHYERICDILETQSVTHDDMEALREVLSFQSLYDNPETHDVELAVLRRVFLGLISWDSSRETAVLDPLPEALDTRVFPYLRYETGGRSYGDAMRDDVESEILRMQRAWATFILQVIAEYDTTTESDRYVLDSIAREAFDEFRQLARLYWLQEFAAVVLRLHLWFLCEYLERALPRPVQRDQLFADIDADAIAEGAATAFDVQVESGDNRASQRRVARELALYGQTPKRTPVIHRPETPTDDVTTIGELRDRVTAQKPSTWDEAHTSLRTSSVVRAIRHIADQLDDISPPDVVLNTWREALGHSLTLLLMVVERYRDLIDDTPVLGAYIEAQHGDDHASLPRLSAYFSAKAADRPLSTIASEFVRDCIITVHDQIVRDRLGSSGPIRLAFSHAAEQDAFRYMGGTGRLGREYLRYGMMQQMLLDLNLVTTTDDDARLTAHGEDILARARRSANTT